MNTPARKINRTGQDTMADDGDRPLNPLNHALINRCQPTRLFEV